MLNLKSPPSRPLVAASILSADFGDMDKDCKDVFSKGADLLHIDVMDGHFVPNLTMGADMVACLRKHFPDAFLDVHLMVERPDMFVDMFAAAGTNNFSFHLEVSQPMRPPGSGGIDAVKLIEKIHKLGMGAGMVVNPPTKVEPIEPFLKLVDLVLIMSVNPGRSGQKFMPEVLTKAKWVKERIGPAVRLEMDGGLSPTTAPQAAAAGVDTMVTASALFGSKDRKAVIDAFHAIKVGR